MTIDALPQKYELTEFGVGTECEMMEDIRTDDRHLCVGYGKNPW